MMVSTLTPVLPPELSVEGKEQDLEQDLPVFVLWHFLFFSLSHCCSELAAGILIGICNAYNKICYLLPWGDFDFDLFLLDFNVFRLIIKFLRSVLMFSVSF